MNCDALRELLYLSPDGLGPEPQLTGEEQRTLALHLEQCEPCRIEQAQLLSIARALAATPPVPVPVGLKGRILTRLSESDLSTRPVGPSRTAQWWAWSAAAALVVAGGLGWWNGAPDSTSPASNSEVASAAPAETSRLDEISPVDGRGLLLAGRPEEDGVEGKRPMAPERRDPSALDADGESTRQSSGTPLSDALHGGVGDDSSAQFLGMLAEAATPRDALELLRASEAAASEKADRSRAAGDRVKGAEKEAFSSLREVRCLRATAMTRAELQRRFPDRAGLASEGSLLVVDLEEDEVDSWLAEFGARTPPATLAVDELLALLTAEHPNELPSKLQEKAAESQPAPAAAASENKPLKDQALQKKTAKETASARRVRLVLWLDDPAVPAPKSRRD